MDAEEFHRLAETLVCRAGAADCRTAISRAYYSAFLYCRDKLQSRGVQFDRDGSVHLQVIKALGASRAMTHREVGDKLDKLRLVRSRADYDLDDAAVERPKNAKYYVEEAERILSRMREI